jgi:hypothetical protein
MMVTPNVIVTLRQVTGRRDKMVDVRICPLHRGDHTARSGFVGA